MNIAYTKGPGRGDTDLLLAQLADALAQDGVRLCGTVQVNVDCGTDGPCDMDVRVLPSGPVLRISQSLGKASRGCRLNAEALETSVGLVEASLANGADVLIINKFGKQEAEGRGFRGAIAEAVSQDIPVLVGVNGLNAEAFQTFLGGTAVELEPTVPALTAWVQARLGRDESAA